ncbi:MAG: SRPBCC family protein [Myxococcota bacterium]
MSVDVTCETVIARPLDAVWAATTNPAHDARWTTGVVEVRPRQPGPLAPGAEVERHSQFLGRRMVYVIRVTEVVEGRLVAMETASGPFPMTVRYEYEPADGGTRFRIRTSGDPGGFYALAAPLVAAAVRRNINNDLATLREWLESEGA